MASGTISLGTSGNLAGQIVWSSSSNGSVANTSTVTGKIQAKRTNSYTTTGTFTGDLTVGSKSESVSYYGNVSDSWVTLKTITETIKHNDDGKGTCYIYGKINGPSGTSLASNSVSGSKTVTLDTIARASVLGTISNFTLGNAINIPITKRSSSFTDSLTISLNGTTIKTINSITNGYDVSFTSDELTKIYKLLPSATTGTFTFKLTTKSGSTTIGTSSKTATGTIPTSVKPTISSVTISEANTEVVPSDWGVFVKNKSKLKFVTSASAGSGSSVSSVKVTINGSTYTGTTITTNIMNKSGTLTATITVTDKRNRSTSTTKTINVLDYGDPFMTTLNAFRCDVNGNANDKGTYLYVILKGGVYSLDGKNTASYEIQYKRTKDNEYQIYTFDVTDDTIDSYVILSNIEATSNYTVRAVITDYFNSVGINTPPISSVFRTLHFKPGGRSIGVGKMVEEDDLFDIGLPTKFNEPVYGNVFGLGYLPPIGENEDLNNYTTPGIYAIPSNTIAKNIANMPINYAGRFIINASLGGKDTIEGWYYLRQEFYPYHLRYQSWSRDVVKNADGDWTFGDWVETSSNKKTLYENSTGTTGSITLTDSVVDYSRIKILFGDLGTTYGDNSLEIDNANGKTACLQISTFQNDYLYHLINHIVISGNTITKSLNKRIRIASTNTAITVTDAHIKIYKVIGYR